MGSRWIAGFSLAWLLIFLPAAARAAGPGGDLYFGYSRLGSNMFYPNVGGLNGWEAAGHVHFIPFVGAELDVSHYGSGGASSIPHSTTVLVGPRVTVGAAGVHVFAHGMAGWEHSASGAPTNIDAGALTVAVGGGIDFRLMPFFAWRVNGDYIDAPTLSPGTSSHSRFGTGLVFRF